MRKKGVNGSIKISAVGDIMLGVAYPHSINKENNILNRLKKDHRSIFRGVEPHLRNTDILFGNFESIIIKDFLGDIQKDPRFLATTEKSIDVLKQAGFDVLNLANNHILDHGREHADFTERKIKSSDFVTIGSLGSKKEKIQVIKRKGVKVGFLGYNMCEQENKTDLDTILRDIRDNKDNVDILVVSLHWGWGKEHMPNPSKTQIDTGHKIIDEGADIILGHHAHVFQPVELYKGKVIAHCLGNFIFDQWRLENKVGGVLEITVNEDMEMDVNIVPTIIDDYRVVVNDQLFDKEEMIVSDMKCDLSKEEYTKILRRKKKHHNREFLKGYVKNSPHMSYKVHNLILKDILNKKLLKRR